MFKYTKFKVSKLKCLTVTLENNSSYKLQNILIYEFTKLIIFFQLCCLVLFATTVFHCVVVFLCSHFAHFML